jgi:hypothetical protein
MPNIAYMGQFDTNPAALTAREKANSNAAHDFDAWVIDQLPLTDNSKILDLGCGSCRQWSKIKERFPNCHIEGVDVNPSDTHEVTVCSFDDYQPSTHFDIILSSYSLYYSQDMVGLLVRLKEWTSMVFLCGPGEGSNKELTCLLPIPDFVTREELSELSDHFRVEVVRLHNEILFESAEHFHSWWENHNSYDPDATFSTPSRLTKNTMGIKLYA